MARFTSRRRFYRLIGRLTIIEILKLKIPNENHKISEDTIILRENNENHENPKSHARITKIMKIIEFDMRITKIKKMNEFYKRIITVIKQKSNYLQ